MFKALVFSNIFKSLEHESQTMTNALFIVGYYRSGTSALSGALQRAGVKFYNEAEPNEHNPLGFYEIPELIDFDARLFTQLGVDWPDVRGLPDNWAERNDIAPFATQLEEIIRRRFTAQDRYWGLKHPHLCRTLPLYERVVRRAGHRPHVLHIFREPWIAAASQCRKNGLSRAHALLLWLTYATNAERQARHLPRSWTTYQDLLTQPRQELQRITSALGWTLENDFTAASASLTGQLNRSEALPRDQLSRTLDRLVARTWEAITSRQFAAELWDELAAETADMVNFLTEIGNSRAQALPAFGNGLAPSPGTTTPRQSTRPLERTDDAAKLRLLTLRAKVAKLPKVGIFIAAPAGRAPAVSITVNSLRTQWEKPAFIKVLSTDALMLDDCPTITVPAHEDAMTQALCQQINLDASETDYVAVLNAGDTVDPDACLRFALLAAQTNADMIYCDEIVPSGDSRWVRHKPGWDLTRLRQAAYIGDWVWYNMQTLRRVGGFNADMAGAEEYDLHLRLAAQNAKVVRLPEALFSRNATSKRDDIAPSVFCARAVEALTRHLNQCGMPATVQNRQYAGLFHHVRQVADPGTSIIMLCDHGEITLLDKWLTALLTGAPLTGPVILAGADVSAEMKTYLTTVATQREQLEGKVLAVLAASPGAALAQAVALAETEFVAFLDARMREVTPYWLEQLRARMADHNVVAVAARTLTPLSAKGIQGQIMGPIVIGANVRLGAGHAPLDPGPGGWLMVDQEASAITPPGLLARRAAIEACQISSELADDALWIDLGAQLRASGGRLVWTPDVSFVMPETSIIPDINASFRTGSQAARALSWSDPYHHPALSLHHDLLATEQRVGLVGSAPTDPTSLLLSGQENIPRAALNAARALRLEGMAEIDWVPGLPDEADLHRRAPDAWIYINPIHVPSAGSPAFTSLFTHVPDTVDILPLLTASSCIYATSPALMERLRPLTPPQIPLELWRPALSTTLWRTFTPGTGLNTKPRVLWIDEANTPTWMAPLMHDTQTLVTWMVVEHPATQTYPNFVTRLPAQDTEQGWVTLLETIGAQIMLRPAEHDRLADSYPTLLAAAAGCRLIMDSRFDAPGSLGALRLPNRHQDWQTALANAVTHLPDTLRLGAESRAAALALPSVEQAPPDWARLVLRARPTLTQAAE